MRLSRRVLARWGAEALMDGQPAGRVAKHLAAAMLESGHRGEAELLIDDIAWELERRGKLSSAMATTASGLSAELRKQLAAKIKETNKVSSVWLSEKTDPAVIGGVRVETPSKVWDHTVKHQLAEIREAFNG